MAATTPPEGASREVEPDATEVDVVASDYMFDMPDTLDAGRTSFVLTNQGHEAHFLEIVKLAEGVTIEQALASRGSERDDRGRLEHRTRRPRRRGRRGHHVRPRAGQLRRACASSPGPDGTPHAFMGMQKEFTVS